LLLADSVVARVVAALAVVAEVAALQLQPPDSFSASRRNKSCPDVAHALQHF
jgi:hypothetical protein